MWRVRWEALPERAASIMHAGVDPTVEQWQEISKLMKEKKLFPFFDMAYQVSSPCSILTVWASCQKVQTPTFVHNVQMDVPMSSAAALVMSI